jgi:chromate transport protein ChrA
LIAAVVVGQFTPGPVVTTATFIGYVVAGIPGAVVATVGIFLPSFVLVAISGPLIPRLRRSRVAGGMRQTLHRSERVARGYIRRGGVFEDNTAVGLV